MKKYFFLSLFVAMFLAIGCDKVKNAYPPGITTDLNKDLYPGPWTDYPWPTFSANDFTGNRNVVIEDYTGQQCVYCPAAAAEAKNIEAANPGRVLIISVHASPGGVGPFQEADEEFPAVLYNETSIAFGKEFQSGFGFDANPAGTIDRKIFNSKMFQSPGDWSSETTQIITANDLKADLAVKANYFPSTRGLFVHALIDAKNFDTTNLKVVTQFIEKKFVSRQKFPAGQVQDDYEQHNVLRGTLDGAPFGQLVSSKAPNEDGNYQFDYSYQIPTQYDPTNCEVIVYLMDKTTYEIYQAVSVAIQ